MFQRLRRSWLLSNRHYLLPVFVLLALVNGILAFGGIIVVLLIYFFNMMRARLPIDPGGEFTSRTLVYKHTGDRELKLDLWLPSNHSDGRQEPLVVFAHGGGWISGYRNQPKNVSWCRFLASKGFAVASVDYRLAPRYRIDEILEDYTDAIGWLGRNASELGFNADRIVLMGLSAGGHIALTWAARLSAETDHAPDEQLNGICGVVAYYAPSDLRDLFSSEDKSLFARLGAGSLLGTTPARDEEAYRIWSPLSWFTEKMIPVMAVHGRRDEIVPYVSSVKMIRRLKDLGVPCRFLVHKTGGHGFEIVRKDYRTTRILEETVGFIRNLTAG